MSEQLAMFEGLVDPPALPAGAPLDRTPKDHLDAMRNPKPGIERAMVGLLRSLAEYAQAHQTKFGRPVSESYFEWEEWKQILSSCHALLSCDLGRLDGAELSRQFGALEEGGGSQESVGAALGATAARAPATARAVGKAATRAQKAPAVEEAAIGTKRLTERQRDLLRLVEVSPENIAVYTGAAHIPDWPALKTVMTSLGGKWRTKKGFLFPEDVDAKELVRLALETGEILDEKEAEFFETPDWLADQLVEWVEPRVNQVILEPSAGRGAIVRALVRRCPDIVVACFEPMPKLRTELEQIPQTRWYGADFWAARDKVCPGGVSGVATNPPFSKRQDIRHITKAFDWLKPGGRLAAVASAGVLYREDREYQAFRALVESNGGTIEKNPDGSFRHVGTGVSTVIIRIVKGAA